MFSYVFVLNVTQSVHFELILRNICVAQFLQNFCNTSVRLRGEGRSFSSRLLFFFFLKYFIDQISCAVLWMFISKFDLDTLGFFYLSIYSFIDLTRCTCSMKELRNPFACLRSSSGSVGAGSFLLNWLLGKFIICHWIRDHRFLMWGSPFSHCR